MQYVVSGDSWACGLLEGLIETLAVDGSQVSAAIILEVVGMCLPTLCESLASVCMSSGHVGFCCVAVVCLLRFCCIVSGRRFALKTLEIRRHKSFGRCFKDGKDTCILARTLPIGCGTHKCGCSSFGVQSSRHQRPTCFDLRILVVL